MLQVGQKCIFNPKYDPTLSEEEVEMFRLNEGHECEIISLDCRTGDGSGIWWVKLCFGQEFCVFEEELTAIEGHKTHVSSGGML